MAFSGYVENRPAKDNLVGTRVSEAAISRNLGYPWCSTVLRSREQNSCFPEEKGDTTEDDSIAERHFSFFALPLVSQPRKRSRR